MHEMIFENIKNDLKKNIEPHKDTLILSKRIH